MKKLFKVVHPKGWVKHFETKIEAKEYRNILNTRGPRQVHVMRGPDHWRGETF
jgi:hypothetical protein